MNRETDTENSSGVAISLSIPPSDPELFKHKATSDVLLFLQITGLVTSHYESSRHRSATHISPSDGQ